MHYLKCSLLAVICSIYWKDSAAQIDSPVQIAENTTQTDTKENEIDIFGRSDTNIIESIPIEGSRAIATATISSDADTAEVKRSQNLIDSVEFTESPQLNSSLSKPEINVSPFFKSTQKRKLDNETFNDIKPFLLFPILPFLFPKETKEKSLKSLKNGAKNESKAASADAYLKPFVFFDFAFNIRQIPLSNKTELLNESKEMNGKKVVKPAMDELTKSQQKARRRRRNTSSKKDKRGFIDDLSLFPDSDMDEFLPKPDLFFPDLSVHHKPYKKLSRRKRDMKKLDSKNDMKFFVDAFDEAFMQTKRVLERTDPILSFLRGSDQSFEGKKDVDDLFSDLPGVNSLRDKPNAKWKVHGNVKRMDDENDLLKRPESPVIIMDKVVKIGEFQLPGEGHDKSKIKKKRETNNLMKAYFNEETHDALVAPTVIQTQHEHKETSSKPLPEWIKREKFLNTRKRKRNEAHSNNKRKSKIDSKVIRILPQANTSTVVVGRNATIELKRKEVDVSSIVNTTGNVVQYAGNLLKVIDSIKNNINMDLINDVGPKAERLKRNPFTYNEKLNSKKPLYDDLKKNITEVLNQFLALVKKLDEIKLLDKLEANEHDDEDSFDWTEKETRENANTLGNKGFKGRDKRDSDFQERVGVKKQDKKISDVTYLFMVVTLPTVCIFGLLLLACFFNLQVKGQICTMLFKPRHILLVDETKILDKPQFI